ncbi:MAG: ATP-binding protein [Saprospiraceae bacterium]|nr:ATP-binding protein [Saprospiraceae bacterium]
MKKRYNYATNPQGCGYYNHPKKDCVCGQEMVKRYVSKIRDPMHRFASDFT